MSLIVKIILLELASALSAPAAYKTQFFVNFSFNSILQLINGNSSDLQKLLKYFDGSDIIAFLDIPFTPSTSAYPNNSVLYLKKSKLLL